MSEPRELRFTPGLAPLVATVAFVSLVAALSVVVHLTVLGPEPSAYPNHVSALLSLPFMSVVLLGTWGVLRHEGVSAAEVGLGRATLLPGVVAFGLPWAWVTAAGTGYLLVTGAAGELGLAVDVPWYWVPVWFLLTLTLSNGLTEEFVFRGYVQSKCTALVPTDARVPAAWVGIFAGAVLFGVPHVPLGVLLEGAGPAAIPWIVLGNLIPGLTYGVVYYLTLNVWYAGFVHGFGNATVVPFDPAAVPLFVPFAAGSGILIAIGYRYRGRTAGRVTISARKRTADGAE